MNKAVFLLCPADHLCPSQIGGLDLNDYYYYYYSVSRAPRSAGPKPRPASRGLKVLWTLITLWSCRRHHDQSGIGASCRSAAPHFWMESSTNVHETTISDQGAPSARRRLNLYPTISPPSSAASISPGGGGCQVMIG